MIIILNKTFDARTSDDELSLGSRKFIYSDDGTEFVEITREKR